MVNLQNLPIEIVYNIIHYVDSGDLVSIVHLNRWWATQFYDTCRKRIYDILDAGWIVRNTVEVLYYGIFPDPILLSGASLVTVLDRIEPLTLDLVFNLHEVDIDGITVLPKQPDNMPSINLVRHGPNDICIEATFIGRNTNKSRIIWIEQLEAVQFELDTSKLSEENTEMKPWKSAVRVSASPDAFVTYSLMRRSIDTATDSTHVNSEDGDQNTDATEEDAPFLLRLENFVCSYKWWISKVEEAKVEAKYRVDDMNIW